MTQRKRMDGQYDGGVGSSVLLLLLLLLPPVVSFLEGEGEVEIEVEVASVKSYNTG